MCLYRWSHCNENEIQSNNILYKFVRMQMIQSSILYWLCVCIHCMCDCVSFASSSSSSIIMIVDLKHHWQWFIFSLLVSLHSVVMEIDERKNDVTNKRRISILFQCIHRHMEVVCGQRRKFEYENNKVKNVKNQVRLRCTEGVMKIEFAYSISSFGKNSISYGILINFSKFKQ